MWRNTSSQSIARKFDCVSETSQEKKFTRPARNVESGIQHVVKRRKKKKRCGNNVLEYKRMLLIDLDVTSKIEEKEWK